VFADDVRRLVADHPHLKAADLRITQHPA
jgi:hypothetical protein